MPPTFSASSGLSMKVQSGWTFLNFSLCAMASNQPLYASRMNSTSWSVSATASESSSSMPSTKKDQRPCFGWTLTPTHPPASRLSRSQRPTDSPARPARHTPSCPSRLSRLSNLPRDSARSHLERRWAGRSRPNWQRTKERRDLRSSPLRPVSVISRLYYHVQAPDATSFASRTTIWAPGTTPGLVNA